MKLSENTMKYSKKIFNNTYFLYFMLVLAIMNVVLYLNTNNYEALFMFVSVGIILKQFTENNSIILLSCIILTNTYVMINNTIDGFRSRYTKNNDTIEGFKKNKLKNNGLKNKGLKSGMSDLSKLDDDDDDAGSSFLDKNYMNNITTYNQMTEAYNNLVKSIRKKTKNIKEMSKKIKLK